MVDSCTLVNFSRKYTVHYTALAKRTVDELLFTCIVFVCIPSCFVFITFQWVLSVDLFANEEADGNVIVNPESSWTGQEAEASITEGTVPESNPLV